MPDKIAVGTVSRTFFCLPYWIAVENGYFAAENLETSLTIYGNASQIPLLLDGSLNVIIGTPEAALHSTVAGGPVRIIAGNAGRLTHSLMARPPFSRVEDLKGGTIGILNMVEGTFFQIKEMLAAHGLHYPGDYKVKETGGAPARHKALLDGSIDAGLQSIPWNYAEIDAGLKHLGDVVEYVPDWQFVTVNASSVWAEAHRSQIVGFLRAMIRATDWLYQNRAGAAVIAARELPTSLDYAGRAGDHYTQTNALTRDVSVNVEGLRRVIDTQIEADLLPKDAPTGTEAYVNDEYLKEARASLDR